MTTKTKAFYCFTFLSLLFATAVQPAVALEGMSYVAPTGFVVDSGGGGGANLNITSPFDIALNFNNVPTAAEAAAFAAAEATWEGIIVSLKDTLSDGIIDIDVNLTPIDGPGGILGSAGPTIITISGVSANFTYANNGVMNFDTADTANLAGAGTLDDVILHEMGHVLGIGTLWDTSSFPAAFQNQQLYTQNSGQYTGANGLAAYNAEFGQAGAFVPVELGGGGGTANGHWNEVDGGAANTGIVSSIEPGPFNDFKYELMTGWLNPPQTFISSLTVQGMMDLGYNVVPEPSSLALMLGGLIVVLRRERTA